MSHKYNYIINPKTNRKVRVDTQLGQNILKRYEHELNQSGGGFFGSLFGRSDASKAKKEEEADVRVVEDVIRWLQGPEDSDNFKTDNHWVKELTAEFGDKFGALPGLEQAEWTAARRATEDTATGLTRRIHKWMNNLKVKQRELETAEQQHRAAEQQLREADQQLSEAPTTTGPHVWGDKPTVEYDEASSLVLEAQKEERKANQTVTDALRHLAEADPKEKRSDLSDQKIRQFNQIITLLKEGALRKVEREAINMLEDEADTKSLERLISAVRDAQRAEGALSAISILKNAEANETVKWFDWTNTEPLLQKWVKKLGRCRRTPGGGFQPACVANQIQGWRAEVGKLDEEMADRRDAAQMGPLPGGDKRRRTIRFGLDQELSEGIYDAG